MSIDLGEKRIGVALSDRYRLSVKPLTIFRRKSRKEDFARFQQVIDERNVTLVVFGLPTYLDGSDSEQTKWVRNYSADFATKTTIPIVYQNEAHTTQRARERSANHRQPVDAIAAAIILEDYLRAISGQPSAISQSANS